MRGLIIEIRGEYEEKNWIIIRLEQGRNVRIRWQPPASHMRGRHSLGMLRSISRFPFGLFGRSSELSPATDCIVFTPDWGAVHGDSLKQWLSRAARGDGRQRRRKLQHTLLGAEIHGLRDYRPGDSMRWIHWPLDGEAGSKLLVCEDLEKNASADLILIVEPWLPAAFFRGGRARDSRR